MHVGYSRFADLGLIAANDPAVPTESEQYNSLEDHNQSPISAIEFFPYFRPMNRENRVRIMLSKIDSSREVASGKIQVKPLPWIWKSPGSLPKGRFIRPAR